MPLTLHGKFAKISAGYFSSLTYFCCFSSNSHRRFSPVQFDSVLRAVQRVLCARCAKKQARVFFFCPYTQHGSLTTNKIAELVVVGPLTSLGIINLKHI